MRLSLAYREPCDLDALMAALAGRGDTVVDGRWERALMPDIDGTKGWVSVTPGAPGRLTVAVEAGDLKVLPGVLARVRRVFDLSADPEAIARDLSVDPLLAPLVADSPGLRLPGMWVDAGEDAPSDRLDGAGPALRRRAERWRPWRAYGVLHLERAGITETDLQRMEQSDGRQAA